MCIVRARQVTIAHAKIHGLMSQVFMHVLSAMSSKKTDASKGRFSDYKKAHLLDKSDPRWLHKKEVCACVRACVDVSLSLSLSLSTYTTGVATTRKGQAQYE